MTPGPPSPDGMSEETAGDGIGCRLLALAFAILATGAAAAIILGLTLALDDRCTGVCERAGFALYGAGAPVSALFAVAAGELPVAPFTDVIVWLLAAAGAARLVERRGRRLGRVLGAIAGAAAVYGVAVSFLIERA